MNPTLETIRSRRSVRFFDSKPIPRTDLQTMIDAANLAPTGANIQPWRFVVVEPGDFYETLKKLALPRYQAWMENSPEPLKQIRAEIDAKVSDPVYYGASAIVFVIGAGMTAALDCPMACQNIMLAARSMGIGSCWVYFGQLVLDDAGVRDKLGIVEGESVYGPIVLGYPREGFPEAPPKKEPRVNWL